MWIHMVMSTTKNETRTKYSKEVSEKWRSQFLIIFDKMDFFMMQPVIEYLFKRDNLRYILFKIYNLYIYILAIAHVTATITAHLVTINLQLLCFNLQTSG